MQARPRRPLSGPLVVVIGVIILTVVIWLLVALGRNSVLGQDFALSATPTRATAYQACQPHVAKGLLAPASAKFPNLSEITVATAGNRFTVTGYVDSQNGFGAMLRSRYTCNIERVAGSDWALISLSFN